MRRRVVSDRSQEEEDEGDAWEDITYCQIECLILVWQTIRKRREEKEEGGVFQIKRGRESWWGVQTALRYASAQVLVD